jgi:alkanesulfonate monooxygenase SsuD/methylene tetrahydromethanopterin reductase-like flavin-dependent oxidoreductase (luciferase family)
VRTGVFFFGSVPMPDAGNAGPVPTDRRYGNDDFAAAYDNLVHWTQTADRLGFDSAWYTEHHFQHEGYEVLPNLILFSVAVAARTERIRLGQMFTVVPQWHPLRLAEDFALADHLTGGRVILGVGRGTVPREAETLGTVVASGDNEMSRRADSTNREQFEEAMEVIKAAFADERFSYTGKHYTFPPPGIPDRGTTVTHLTLVPRPRGPVEIWQPISSADTLEYAPAVGHKGVFWLGEPATIRQRWERYGEVAAEHGRDLRPGEDRMLVLSAHVGRTREEAVARVRDAHDEFCRFLAPYGRFGGYRTPDGEPVPFGFQPTLEDTLAQDVMAVGSVDDVVDVVGRYRELLGVEYLTLFLEFPGLSREQIDEQLALMAGDVLPRAGISLPTA